MAGYGLTGKQLQPARLRNLYGGLQLRETTAAYGGGFGVYTVLRHLQLTYSIFITRGKTGPK